MFDFLKLIANFVNIRTDHSIFREVNYDENNFNLSSHD